MVRMSELPDQTGKIGNFTSNFLGICPFFGFWRNYKGKILDRQRHGFVVAMTGWLFPRRPVYRKGKTRLFGKNPRWWAYHHILAGMLGILLLYHAEIIVYYISAVLVCNLLYSFEEDLKRVVLTLEKLKMGADNAKK